jgi:hypothetical protein
LANPARIISQVRLDVELVRSVSPAHRPTPSHVDQTFLKVLCDQASEECHTFWPRLNPLPSGRQRVFQRVDVNVGDGRGRSQIVQKPGSGIRERLVDVHD